MDERSRADREFDGALDRHRRWTKQETAIRSKPRSWLRPGSAHYVSLAELAALQTAGFLLLARLLKLGFFADFLSRTVLVGFLTDLGFQVGIAVLSDMLKLEVHGTNPVDFHHLLFADLPAH